MIIQYIVSSIFCLMMADLYITTKYFSKTDYYLK